MDNSIDSDSENDSGCRDDSRYLKFIELLIDKSIKRLESESYQPKIQDALRAIRLKEKVFKSSEAEKFFWQEIENIREEELPKMYPEPEPVDLESEIRNTILELRYQVENGILPVKSITDAFNQSRSKESQLTYRRVGELLTTMGFRKARIHDNNCAIFWDDNLLSWRASSQFQNGLSDVEKKEKLPPPRPPRPAVTLPAPQVRGWRSS
jgi:hypothetical protein